MGAHDVVKEALGRLGHGPFRQASPCSRACPRVSALVARTRFRSSRCPATPSVVLRLVPGLRPARAARRCSGLPAGAPRRPCGAVTTPRSARPQGKRSLPARTLLYRRRLHVAPVPRAGLPPARRPGRGQRPDRGARGRRPNSPRARRWRSSRCSERDQEEPGERFHPPRRDRRGPHGRRLGQGRLGPYGDAPPAGCCCPPRPWPCCASGDVPKGDAIGDRPDRRDHGRQAHPRPDPALPPDRAARRQGRPGRGRRRASRSPPGQDRRPHRRRDGGADLRSPSPRSP